MLSGHTYEGPSRVGQLLGTPVRDYRDWLTELDRATFKECLVPFPELGSRVE